MASLGRRAAAPEPVSSSSLLAQNYEAGNDDNPARPAGAATAEWAMISLCYIAVAVQTLELLLPVLVLTSLSQLRAALSLLLPLELCTA
jgi:hypothetical protein